MAKAKVTKAIVAVQQLPKPNCQNLGSRVECRGFQGAYVAMARIVRDSEAFGGVGDDDDATFMETEDSEDAGTVKRNPRLVTRKVELSAGCIANIMGDIKPTNLLSIT